MIEFKGELTGRAREFAKRRYFRLALLATAVCSLVYAVFIPLSWHIFGPFGLCFLIAVPVPMLLYFEPFREKEQKGLFPIRAFVDPEEQSVVIETEAGELFVMFDGVNNVYDYGEWYHFVLSPLRNSFFIFQKDLLVSGTLEELEELFADKIIRMK